MNINDYIARFGTYSFKELPFNDVDAFIFAEFVYINFDILISNDEKIKLCEIKEKHLKSKELYDRSVDARHNKKMLNLMVKSNRYKDVIVQDAVNIFSYIDTIQFGAFNVQLDDNTLIILFRGTDTSLLGWKEDFRIIYKDEIPSEKLAMEYYDRIVKKYPHCNYYLAGHSKGGMVAFYCAMNTEPSLHSRMITGYNFDGPGFRGGLDRFPYRKEVEPKLKKFITHRDFVGSIYNNHDNSIIVKSTGFLLGGHDPFYWKVNKVGHFIIKERIKNKARKRNIKFMYWLNSLTYEERLLAIEGVFVVFRHSHQVTELLTNLPRAIFSFHNSMKCFDKDDRVLFKNIFKRLFKIMFFKRASKIKDGR